MSALEFRIRHPDGRMEQVVVDSERVLVGSGAHCEVRLPPEHAAVEHLLFTHMGRGVHAQARALQPPPTLNGSPFTQAPVLPTSVVGVGGVALQVAPAQVDGGAVVVKKKQEKTSAMTYVLVALALPLAGYLLLVDEEGAAAVGPPPKAPALFDKADVKCPHAGEQALAFARDKRLLAQAKRERSPFHVADGVAAPPIFDLAAACFRASGDGAGAGQAAEMDEAAKKMREALSQDYKAHQMRLEHSLAVKDYATAQREARMLLSMVEGTEGKYQEWLSNLDRKLELRRKPPKK